MTDHFSGPRAIAGPEGDICDLFAFPSPERPGRLVLAMNILPNASPSALFSDAIVCRFRLRPLSIAGARFGGSLQLRPNRTRTGLRCYIRRPSTRAMAHRCRRAAASRRPASRSPSRFTTTGAGAPTACASLPGCAPTRSSST